ncbi:hypothetical protein HK104_005385, partial [Borealophlyctis nickersoniae]
MTNIFPRFLSGFIVQDTTWLNGARLSIGMQPIGSRPVDIGAQLNPFRTAYANTFHNQYRALQVNHVLPELPIKVSTQNNVATIGLSFDNTLQLNSNGQLGVKSQITTPSGKNFTCDAPLFFDSTKSNVSLLFEDDDFKIEDSKLTLVPEIWKARGGLRLSDSVAEALAHMDVWDLDDFSDVDITDDTPAHLKLLQWKTSEDFIQSGGRLRIKPQTPGCIPWYTINGTFGVNTGFQFDGATTLSVRFVKIENSFQLQDDYAAPVGFVMQAYQSSDNTAIDISSPQNGRRIVSVRTDNETIRIDSATNKLSSTLVWDAPLELTKSNVSIPVTAPISVVNNSLDIAVDGTSVKKVGGQLSATNYTAGKGIQISNYVISTSEDVLDDLSFQYPLTKIANTVTLNLTGVSPININDASGSVSLAIDNTLKIEAGKLSVIPVEPLTNGDGILIENKQISFLGDLHHFDYVDTQTKLRLKPGRLIESDIEGLFVSLQGENGVLYENGIIRLLFDLSHYKLSAGDELQLNLSNIFTSSHTEGLDLKVDNSTIKKDPTVGLKGGYQAKSGSAINVIGNLIGENITASNGVTRVGSELRVSYTGVGMIYVSGSSIGIREADLDQKIADKTGISRPQSAGGGGGSPFSDLGKGLSSILGAGVGAIFGGVAEGISGGAIGGSTGLTSSGITSGIAAGVSMGGAAVSLGSTLSHGFGYASQGISAGNLADDQGGYGFSLGNATLLYPDVYTDKNKSVCAIGYLKGSSNTTIVDSESPTTGTLCVLGGVGIYKNLHVREAVYAQGFKCRRGVAATWWGNTFNLYWSGEVQCWIDVTHVGDIAFKHYVQENFKPLTWEPDLSSYYNRSQVDSITSTLASKDSVFSKEESDGRFMSMDHQIDLSNYYT